MSKFSNYLRLPSLNGFPIKTVKAGTGDNVDRDTSHTVTSRDS
ncbi:17082_t:CDS:2, partial [Dentiscutata heterogama]